MVGPDPRGVETRLVSLTEHGRRVQTQAAHVGHHADPLKHPHLSQIIPVGLLMTEFGGHLQYPHSKYWKASGTTNP